MALKSKATRVARRALAGALLAGFVLLVALAFAQSRPAHIGPAPMLEVSAGRANAPVATGLAEVLAAHATAMAPPPTPAPWDILLPPRRPAPSMATLLQRVER